MADEKDWKPSDEIFYRGYYHDDVFYDNINYEHIEAYMDVDGELRCVWRKPQGPPVPDAPEHADSDPVSGGSFEIPWGAKIGYVDGYDNYGNLRAYIYGGGGANGRAYCAKYNLTTGDASIIDATSDYEAVGTYMDCIGFVNSSHNVLYVYPGERHDQVNFPYHLDWSGKKYVTSITWTQTYEEGYPDSGNVVGSYYEIDYDKRCLPATLFKKDAQTHDQISYDIDDVSTTKALSRAFGIRGSWANCGFRIVTNCIVDNGYAIYVNPVRYCAEAGTVANQMFSVKSKGYISVRLSPYFSFPQMDVVNATIPHHYYELTSTNTDRYGNLERIYSQRGPRASFTDETYTSACTNKVTGKHYAIRTTADVRHFWGYTESSDLPEDFDYLHDHAQPSPSDYYHSNCCNYDRDYQNNNFWYHYYSDNGVVPYFDQTFDSTATNVNFYIDRVSVTHELNRQENLVTHRNVVVNTRTDDTYGKLTSNTCGWNDWAARGWEGYEHVDTSDLIPVGKYVLAKLVYKIDTKGLPTYYEGFKYYIIDSETDEVREVEELNDLQKSMFFCQFATYRNGVYKFAVNGVASGTFRILSTYDFTNFKVTTVKLPSDGRAVETEGAFMEFMNDLYYTYRDRFGSNSHLGKVKLW